EHEAEPSGDAHVRRTTDVTARAEFAGDRAEERTEHDARQAEEETHERADRRAPECVLARADAARARKAGDEVDRDRGDAENAEDAQRERTDVVEMIGPGREQHARE